MSTVSDKYSTMSRVSSMTFHTRLKVLNTWYSILYSSLSTCLRLRDVILRGILYPHIHMSCRQTTAPFRRTRTSPRSHRRTSANTSPRGSTDRTRIFWTQRRRLTRWSTTRLPLPVAWTSTRTCVGQLVVLFFVLYCFCGRAISKLLP